MPTPATGIGRYCQNLLSVGIATYFPRMLSGELQNLIP